MIPNWMTFLAFIVFDTFEGWASRDVVIRTKRTWVKKNKK